MLLRTVHLPKAYVEADSASSSTAALSLVLEILEHCRCNCVLLTDDGYLLQNELYEAIRKWPPKYSQRGRMLLADLQKKHRFVPVSVSSKVTSPCGGDLCGLLLSIVNMVNVDCGILGQGCSACCHLPDQCPHTSWAEYSLSTFSSARRGLERIEIQSGKWSKQRFEEAVLTPLFRYAKSITIVDRMVGRHLVDRGRHLGAGVVVGAHYRKTLEWICEVIARDGKRVKQFEIISGVDSNAATPAEIAEAALVLTRFGVELAERFMIDVKMIVRREGAGRLPHCRYLITDQIGLLVDRGFDLLQGEMIRDVAIGIASDPGVIIDEAKRLPGV